MTRKLRRNDVVVAKNEGGHWSPYGRVWRRIDESHVEVICVTKHLTVYADEDVKRVDYKGRWDTWSDLRQEYPVWLSMPTLRKLKQRASYYHDDVWKKPKPSIRESEYAWMAAHSVKAPFSDKQVARIRDWQERGRYMPEVCDRAWYREENGSWPDLHARYQKKHNRRHFGQLDVVNGGMVCPVCGFEKNSVPRYTIERIEDNYRDW